MQQVDRAGEVGMQVALQVRMVLENLQELERLVVVLAAVVEADEPEDVLDLFATRLERGVRGLEHARHVGHLCGRRVEFALEQLTLGGACDDGRKVVRLVEVLGRDVRVDELSSVIEEDSLDARYFLEGCRISEFEQAPRLLVEEQRGGLCFLVNLLLFLLYGVLDFFLECGLVLVEVLLGEEHLVLDVAESEKREDGRRQDDTAHEQEDEDQVAFGEVHCRSPFLQGETGGNPRTQQDKHAACHE